MKILHLSDDGLPDWRVEKSALTAVKQGHQVFFAGRLRDYTQGNHFSEVYRINWTAGALIGLPYYFHCVKKQVEKLVKLVKPDIVHSHNIGSAKISNDLRLPFVFDDHEYFTVLSKVNAENVKVTTGSKNESGPRKFISEVKSKFVVSQSLAKWPQWEGEAVCSAPTITVSEHIARALRKKTGSKNIFVVPNFPLKEETSDIERPLLHDELSSVYAGGDKKNNRVSNRDISGLTDIFVKNDIGSLTIIGWEQQLSRKIKATGFLPRKEMYCEMYKNSIGLVPWKKHWSHPFLNPNKAYEYAHAGLFVMLTADLTSLTETLGANCTTFEDYGDMVEKVRYYAQNKDELYGKRVKIFDFARNNLIWENYEEQIMNAYSLC
jgi:glycosyltransferase involved in cell wall biosynthesis